MDPVIVQVDNQPVSITPVENQPLAVHLGDFLPAEFKDKPFFKDKSVHDVIKEHVNLQTLLGQRPAGIPKDDASEEEWGKFFDAVKPKSVDEYQFPETDFSKSHKRNPEYETAIRSIMSQAGIPRRAFPKVVEGIEKFLSSAEVTQANQKKIDDDKRSKDFETLLDTTYKTEKQAVLDRTKKLMTESVAPEMKEKVAAVLKDISNDTLFALTAVLDGVYKKHIAEDNPPSGGSGGSGDAASLQTEAEKIMGSKDYQDWRLPGHDASRQKVQDLFKQIAALREKK